MISTMRVEMNINLFKQDMFRLIAKCVAQSIPAMDEAMKVFKDDCLEKIPKCPIDLRPNADNRVLRESHEIQKTIRKKDAVIGTLRVRQSYAAVIHEGVSPEGISYTYHAPETGSHWVLAKLLMFGEKYTLLAAEGTLLGDNEITIHPEIG